MLVEIPSKALYINTQHLVCIWVKSVTLFVETSTQVRHFSYANPETAQAALNKIRVAMDN